MGGERLTEKIKATMRGRGRETEGEERVVSSSVHWESQSLLCRAKDLVSAFCDVSSPVLSATPTERNSAF